MSAPRQGATAIEVNQQPGGGREAGPRADLAEQGTQPEAPEGPHDQADHCHNLGEPRQVAVITESA
ncbi:hypothetical protein IPM09_03150 [Candidatus Saccharibacteria bacterium]|nr:MAG: hypothetical protein IPM09_03150 [Candidatus Saccharibacteria bacterium]